MTTPSLPLISLRGIGRRYPAASGVPALDEVDLDIAAGEFVAIVGRSGAGKSTLLNVLGLLDSADDGTYLLSGIDTGALAERDRDALRSRTFGFVFQDSFVLPRESVARNTALPLRMRGERVPSQARSVAAALARFGLLDLAEQTAGTLSGGERQRVALARAIAGEPTVILADEPTGNLDSTNTAMVMGLLADLNRSGATVVVITHSNEVADLADRRIRIDDGRVIADSTARPDAPQPGSSAPPAPIPPAPTPPVPTPPAPRRRTFWHLADAVTSLLLAPARTTGILIAFVIAIAGLVSAVNLSATAADQISDRLNAAALDSITVGMPEDATAADLHEASAAAAAIDGVVAAGPRVQIPATSGAPGRWVGSSAIVSDAAVLAVDGATLGAELVSVWPETAAGWLDAADGSAVAILGSGAAAGLGIPTTRVGDTITIAGQSVVVVGFITRSPRDPALTESILVSLTDLVLPAQSELQLLLRTEPGRPAAIAGVVPVAIAPGHPEAISVQTVADLRSLTRGVTDDLSLNILLVSAILLLLVCFTSATSMFLTVTARTREVALRRAVGATRRDIRSLFLIEGTVIGLAGGVSGLALGTLATTVLSSAQGWAPTFDGVSALVGVAAGIVAGAASAVVPAVRASRIEPALALRSA